jgi:hypothetical protein
MNFELWRRSFESCRALVLLILFLSLSYSFSSILCNLGEEGSFLLRLVRKVRLAHEGGARREASLYIAYFLSNRSKLRRTCLFIVCASRDLTCEAGVAAHHTHTHRQSSENIFARILFKISTRRDSPLHGGQGALS